MTLFFKTTNIKKHKKINNFRLVILKKIYTYLYNLVFTIPILR